MGEPHPFRVARVLALRRRRLPSFQIARAVKLGKATVSRLLRRPRLRFTQLSPPPPVVRYERAHPGELLHFDIKKLARIERIGHRITGDRQHDHFRGAGWEFLHIAIDDHSRLAFAQLLPDETAASAITFLHAALAFFHKHGVTIQRVYSDNGSCSRAHAMRHAVASLGLKHRFTRPYTPKTKGKAERFIQTSLREWASAQAYSHSDQRSARLPCFLHNYNWHRPHHSLNLRSPVSRLRLHMNNLLSLHTTLTVGGLVGFSVRSTQRLYGRLRLRILELTVEEARSFVGEVEIDESYFGACRVRGKRGRGAGGKTSVIGLLKRGGKVFTEIVENCSKQALMPTIKGEVLSEATIYTDDWKSYDGLVLGGYKHHRIHHHQNQFAVAKITSMASKASEALRNSASPNCAVSAPNTFSSTSKNRNGVETIATIISTSSYSKIFTQSLSKVAKTRIKLNWQTSDAK